MKTINNAVIFSVVLGTIALLPAVSYADRNHDNWHSDHHYYRYHDHPHFGLSVSFLPDSFFTVSMGNRHYYYYDGIYYNRIGSNYIIVQPPIGAVVNVLPSDFRPVTINGVTYYIDNGTYYVYTRNGYQVVPQPVVYVQPSPVNPEPVVVNAAQTNSYAEDAFTVNIPNNKGGYTAVLIKRSGKGFIGPQGEYYNEFPRVAQLKVMYVK